jgi:hypothetical protein
VVPQAPEGEDGGGGMTKRNEALAALTTFRLEPVTAETVAEPPQPQRKTVANSSRRAMLYLPPPVKRKFEEIAFHEERKEHDVYIEALREYLERRGHRGLL